MSDVDDAERVLRGGGAVLVPTDTVYGIAALPDHIDRLYELKDRPASVPIAVLVADVEQAASLGRLDDRARRLAERFWPGPLTLVLDAGAATVGVRCPDHDLVRELARRVGPLPTTSANPHAAPPPTTAAAAAAALAGEPDLVIDGGELAATASTVVDVSEAEVRILREGVLASAVVLAALH